MKKSLIALAIASAVSAPAFAATSNVDIYGKLHMSMNFYNDQADADNNFGITNNASRLGFKGTEDLGGGLTAIWQIESGVSLDEQTGTLASRNSFLGLKGAWGTALLGNHDTPLKLVGRAVDLFGDTQADSRNVMGFGSDTRAKNALVYVSPDMSGFSVAAAYVADITTGASASSADAADKDVFNLNATYTNGPLFLGAGYGDGDGHTALGYEDHWRVAGGYTFGNFKIVGQYDSLSDDATLTGGLGGDYDAWMVGASYTSGAMVFKANYMSGEVDVVAGDLDKEQWTIGMDYNLSKRTSVYVLYVDGTNIALGQGASASDVVPGAVVVGDDDISAISMGVVHSF